MPKPTFRKHLPAVTLAAIALTGASSAAIAQTPHRARLSRDLADRIAQRVEAPAEIIVTAPDATIDQLVRRYGATLKKRSQSKRHRSRTSAIWSSAKPCPGCG